MPWSPPKITGAAAPVQTTPTGTVGGGGTNTQPSAQTPGGGGRSQFRMRFGGNCNDHRLEHLADAPFGAMLDAVNQQVALRLRGLNVVAQRGDLPVPQLDRPIPDGAQYLVHLDFAGHELNRVYTWREILGQISPDQEVRDGTTRFSAPGTTLQTGEWISSTLKDWVTGLRSDPRPTTDIEDGDQWLVNEPDHEELWDFDGTAWHNLYSADRVKAWIAALNLFEGTTNEDGHSIPGAVQFAGLPDLPANTDPDLAAHHFTFVGTPGYVIRPTDPHGLGADLAGAILNPGDWIQAVNQGTATAPDMHWVHIGGDLLAKSRGDRLYGLQPWADGSWEQGSLVLFGGDVYRATVGVVAGDPQPDAAVVAPSVQPWQKLGLSGGLKIAQVDPGGGTGALPLSAPAGEVWLVLQSARAGNKQALFAYDAAAGVWQELGGGGTPLDLTGGVELINIGLPIGSITAYPSLISPPGWLLCDGRVIPAQYKELIWVCGPNLPDLRDQFIRGASIDSGGIQRSYEKKPDTTRLPRKAFVADKAGSHRHSINTDNIGSEENQSGYVTAGGNRRSGMIWGVGRDDFLQNAGEHTHTISGGDPETLPPHVRLAWIIKATDRFVRPRTL